MLRWHLCQISTFVFLYAICTFFNGMACIHQYRYERYTGMNKLYLVRDWFCFCKSAAILSQSPAVQTSIFWSQKCNIKKNLKKKRSSTLLDSETVTTGCGVLQPLSRIRRNCSFLLFLRPWIYVSISAPSPFVRPAWCWKALTWLFGRKDNIFVN